MKITLKITIVMFVSLLLLVTFIYDQAEICVWCQDTAEPVTEIQGKVVEQPKERITGFSSLPLFLVVIMLLLISMLRFSEITTPNVKYMIGRFEKLYIRTRMSFKKGMLERTMKLYDTLGQIYEDLLTVGSGSSYLEDMQKLYHDIFLELAHSVQKSIYSGELDKACSDYLRLDLMYKEDIRKKLSSGRKYRLYNLLRRLYYQIEAEKLEETIDSAEDTEDALRLYPQIVTKYHEIAPKLHEERRERLHTSIKNIYVLIEDEESIT